jgi:nitronate monooxygenase
MGVISSAGLYSILSLRDGKPLNTYDAVRTEIEKAQSLSHGGYIGINVMCALVGSYEATIRAAIDAKVGAIISGAGLPLGLPGIQPPGHTALIPIVSSARCLLIILKRWERLGYRPDAVVLEGYLAGGHLGFSMDEIGKPEFALEKLLIQVLEVASKYGNIPVIVAGGIYTHEDILRFLAMGASGVQMGTRFLATHESSATDLYKQAVLDAREEDIMVVADPEATPASPCGLPFRILKSSPMYVHGHTPKCNLGYVLRPDKDGKLSVCKARPNLPGNDKFFCICRGLLASAGYAPTEPPLYTVGTNAYRVKEIVSVAELMAELCGKTIEA